VVVGDGELGEGSVWEALMSAAHHRLANICILVDRNGVQSSGATADVLNSSPLSAKLAAFGFSTRDVDGHSVGALHAVLADLPFEPARPSALICRTIKGRGIPAAEGNADWHYRHDLSPANVEELRTVIRRAARWPRYD
jgi:transketolase